MKTLAPGAVGRHEAGRRGAARLAFLVVLLVALVAVRAFVVTPVRVESSSMQPTFVPGDVVLTSRAQPTVPELRRGDLVVFRSPEDGRRTLKRVVGVPGDRLVLLDGELVVNDRVVAEPWSDPAWIDGYFSRTFSVPTDTVFVLGDNRGNSLDSRDYGPVAVADLTGRVLWRLWPVER